MTGGIMHTFSQLILHHEMLNIGRVTIVKVLFPVLVHIFNIDLFEFSAVILEKGLLQIQRLQAPVILDLCLKKTQACAEKPHDDRDVSVLENLRFTKRFRPTPNGESSVFTNFTCFIIWLQQYERSDWLLSGHYFHVMTRHYEIFSRFDGSFEL